MGIGTSTVGGDGGGSTPNAAWKRGNFVSRTRAGISGWKILTGNIRDKEDSG